jgi:hypothetical protein
MKGRNRQKEHIIVEKYAYSPVHVRLRKIEEIEEKLFKMIEEAKEPMHESKRHRVNEKIEMLTKDYVSYLV